MGGKDKALIELGGKRLIDLAIARLEPQMDRILISGRSDYGTGLTVLEDMEEGPRGPAAGLAAALRWIERHAKETPGLLTVPVDGPFLPEDLYKRLSSGGGSAVAADADRIHPTFAYWRTGDLADALRGCPPGEGVSLHALAERCGARPVRFASRAVLNVNTPEDIEKARGETE